MMTKKAKIFLKNRNKLNDSSRKRKLYTESFYFDDNNQTPPLASWKNENNSRNSSVVSEKKSGKYLASTPVTSKSNSQIETKGRQWRLTNINNSTIHNETKTKFIELCDMEDDNSISCDSDDNIKFSTDLKYSMKISSYMNEHGESIYILHFLSK